MQKIQDIQNTQIQMKTQIQIQIYKSKQYRSGELRSVSLQNGVIVRLFTAHHLSKGAPPKMIAPIKPIQEAEVLTPSGQYGPRR